MKENNNTGESSNGRTPDFDSEDVGSNPASPSITRKEYLKGYQKSYQRNRYLSNKDAFHAKNKKAELEKRKWFDEEIVAKSHCVKCGFSHPGALDFHHRDPSEKYMEVTKMVKAKCSKQKILKEIAKCDVLCSNCHRILHWNERNSN